MSDVTASPTSVTYQLPIIREKWELLASFKLGCFNHFRRDGSKAYAGSDGRLLCEHGENPSSIRSWIADAKAYKAALERWQAGGGALSGEPAPVAPSRPSHCNCQNVVGLSSRERVCVGPSEAGGGDKQAARATPALPASIYDVLRNARATTFESHYYDTMASAEDYMCSDDEEALPNTESATRAIADNALRTPLCAVTPKQKADHTGASPQPERRIYLGRSGTFYCCHGHRFLLTTPEKRRVRKGHGQKSQLPSRRLRARTGQCACIMALPNRSNFPEIPFAASRVATDAERANPQ